MHVKPQKFGTVQPLPLASFLLHCTNIKKKGDSIAKRMLPAMLNDILDYNQDSYILEMIPALMRNMMMLAKRKMRQGSSCKCV
jgi:hypothetical protein